MTGSITPNFHNIHASALEQVGELCDTHPALRGPGFELPYVTHAYRARADG